MKPALILTVIILAGGVAADRIIRGKTRDASEALHKATAASVPSGKTEEPRGETGRPRPAGANDTRSLLAGLLALAKELEASSEKDDLATLDARRDAMLDWQRRLTGLEPEQMKELITGILNAPELDDETRQSLLRLLLESLTERHPLETLGSISASPTLIGDPGWKMRITSDAMIRGIAEAPDEVIRWYEDHVTTFSDRERDIITDRVLRALGQTEPELAFRMIKGLGIQDIGKATGAIASSARTLDQASESLAAFRDHLPTFGNAEEQDSLRFGVNMSLITNSFNHGFDEAVDWIGTAGFSQKELADYIFRVQRNVRQDEASRWLGWIDENITDRSIVSKVIPDLVSDWTQTDYKAAAEWLERQPDSDFKTSAVQSHALTLAHHQPEAAARWAATMPEGEARASTMKMVFDRWRTTDAAGAEAFAEKHGIGP
ncbi:hypothetical protein OVA24_04170 [Luteolibacter sp. SL250]|uniref:hypothetical protein n=1 Tax=Luteolibacter sp. SL250 TaxID=2995170 RepID=UPI00226DF47E|nr:hypothetical protein [Luteolibacter sp. SL250]WAC20573.1 hypothetical protein OVA24_04170 [Luteolibacter sp. SL250]